VGARRVNEIEGGGSENERALERRDGKLSGGERGARGREGGERERERERISGRLSEGVGGTPLKKERNDWERERENERVRGRGRRTKREW